jgi:nucleotidyltransferase/DNA polymerase involved in DNA repair
LIEVNKLKSEKLLIELRREKVLELLAQGLQQNRIAAKLNVSTATISLDLQFLRCRAEDNLRRHIQDSLPLTYDKAMSALTQVLQKVWNIAENTDDEKTRLQAHAQFMDAWKYIVDMSASSPRITSALKYVSDIESKKIEQEQQEQEQEQSSAGLKDSDQLEQEQENE